MIEIEKKFALKDEDAKRLLDGATFIKEIVMVDSYYDLPERTLSLKDWWLRERNGAFELKMSAYEGNWREQEVNQYTEAETDPEIAAALGLTIATSLRDSLQKAGYAPFATITTTRRKYTKEGFAIDMDVMDFGYAITEIELMIEDVSQTQVAVEKILAFARKNNLVVGPVRGKLLELLYRTDRAFFDKLTEKGAH